ncbi:hypothetical protein [Kibdelosporangium aridum]|uniref:hypothetical protein n=1 Tax=Kibdelosporangium aridum TaxID=2030 RepID=UPI000A7C79D5|nr:hypothetical protein [Kibdelosporangium aridum]
MTRVDSNEPPSGNWVNLNAQGDLKAGQVAGRDIRNVRKRTTNRIGLTGLAVLAVVGGGSAVIVNVTGDSDGSTIVYQEGMSSDDVALVGAADDDKGAAQTAVIFLQAAVVGDASTACQLVSAETRSKGFALTGCERTVLQFADRIEKANGPGASKRMVDALATAGTTVRMRGSATAEIVVKPAETDAGTVRTVRENNRWRVSSTSITALRMSLSGD